LTFAGHRNLSPVDEFESGVDVKIKPTVSANVGVVHRVHLSFQFGTLDRAFDRYVESGTLGRRSGLSRCDSLQARSELDASCDVSSDLEEEFFRVHGPVIVHSLLYSYLRPASRANACRGGIGLAPVSRLRAATRRGKCNRGILRLIASVPPQRQSRIGRIVPSLAPA
jgi:hypothetical protein